MDVGLRYSNLLFIAFIILGFVSVEFSRSSCERTVMDVPRRFFFQDISFYIVECFLMCFSFLIRWLLRRPLKTAKFEILCFPACQFVVKFLSQVVS